MRLKHTIASIIFVLLLMLPAVAISQSVKDVFRSLKRIEASTQVGVTYKEYMSLVVDAKLEMNLYLANRGGKKNDCLTNALDTAMLMYQKGGVVWQINNTQGNKSYGDPQSSWIRASDMLDVANGLILGTSICD